MIGSVPENLQPIKAVSQKALPIRNQGLFCDLLKSYCCGRSFQKHPPLTLEAESTVVRPLLCLWAIGGKILQHLDFTDHGCSVHMCTNKFIVLCLLWSQSRVLERVIGRAPLGLLFSTNSHIYLGVSCFISS